MAGESAILNQTTIRIALLWVIGVTLIYVVFRGDPVEYLTASDKHVTTGDKYSSIDAIAFIVMGKMASDPMVDLAISALRNTGKWKKSIYVLTDAPNCFEATVRDSKVDLIIVPPESNVIHIKAMKPMIMDYLPQSVSTALYIDADIIVARNMGYFVKEFNHLVQYTTKKKLENEEKNKMKNLALRQKKNPSTNTSLIISEPTTQTEIDFAAFPDSKGHFWGWCYGCEKWHTGVLWQQRGQGTKCMKAWRDILLSGKYQTDQESLDEAEKSGSCPNALFLTPNHLLFAKDYSSIIFSAGQTFIHFTGAANLNKSDYFYREIVVPNLRHISYHNPSIGTAQKECKVSDSVVVVTDKDKDKDKDKDSDKHSAQHSDKHSNPISGNQTHNHHNHHNRTHQNHTKHT